MPRIAETVFCRVSDGRLSPLAACCLALGLLVSVVGCQTTSHRQHREEAQRHWSQVRSKVKRQLASQQFEAGHTRAAISTVEEALGMDPTDVENYVLLIRALLEQGDLAGAERALRAAESMGLESAELAYMRGVVAERGRKLSAALEAYQRALRLDPTQMDYLVAEAECLVALDRPEEARERVLEAIDGFDRDGTLDTLLAEVCLVLGDDQAAAEAFRRALPLVGTNGLVAEEYGLLAVRLGRYAEALSVLRPLVEDSTEHKPSGAVIRGLTQCYLELGRANAAASLIREWLQDHPEDTAAWMLQARTALAAADFMTARRAARVAARQTPTDAEAHLILGYACWKQGDPQQARAWLERTLTLDPDNALVHCLLGQLLVETGQPDRARHHWQRALQIDPRSVWAATGLEQLDTRQPNPRRQAVQS